LFQVVASVKVEDYNGYGWHYDELINKAQKYGNRDLVRRFL